MKLDRCLCVFLLLVVLTTAAKKGRRKDRKSPPQWKSSSMPSQDITMKSELEGKDVKLDCKASGHPKPSVTWTKDGVKLMESDNIQVKKWVLNLKSLSTDMSGNYTCKVSNKHGDLEWTFLVLVTGEPAKAKPWPLELEGPQNITQLAGTTVSFRCRVLNDPLATIRWQKGSDKNNMDNSYSPQPEFLPDGDEPGVLVLENISKDDEGEYRCMAGNVYGLRFSPAWLTVIEPVLVPRGPKVPGKDNNEGSKTPDGYTPYDPNNRYDMNTGRDPYYPDRYNPGGGSPFDYGPDLYFTTTTRRPKNRNKNNRRKNKNKNKDKNKDKNRFELDLEKEEEDMFENFGRDVTTTPTTTTTTYYPVVTTNQVEKKMDSTSLDDVWNMNRDNDDYEGVADSRYKPPSTGRPEKAKESEDPDNRPEGSISSWTIYTIVGAVSGVILLVGLVAITLALCCKKEEGGVYKSTPV